ncbi:hypothetical protein ACS0TY_006681 [Phlomoides rotata]
MITGGHSLKKFHDLVCQDCKDIKLTYFIMIIASAHFVFSQLSSFNSISGVSLAATVMSISYSSIAWGASVNKGTQLDVQYGYKSRTTVGVVFNFFSALGTVAFAYNGHNVMIEIHILFSPKYTYPKYSLTYIQALELVRIHGYHSSSILVKGPEDYGTVKTSVVNISSAGLNSKLLQRTPEPQPDPESRPDHDLNLFLSHGMLCLILA